MVEVNTFCYIFTIHKIMKASKFLIIIVISNVYSLKPAPALLTRSSDLSKNVYSQTFLLIYFVEYDIVRKAGAYEHDGEQFLT